MENKIVPIVPKGSGNTKLIPKQPSPAKKWCFTFNNYTKDELSSIVPVFQSECKFGIVAHEVGEEGTPHLQGYLEFIKKCRAFGNGGVFHKYPKMHFEKARESRQENVDYCSKDNNILWIKGFPRPIKVIEPTYEWEIKILNILKNEPDDRTIYWIVGGVNSGKSSFVKYLCVKNNALLLSGKANDMKHGIVTWFDKHNDTPELIVMNIPKSFCSEYVSYEGIENIKDMLFYSGKYEGGTIVGNPPHLFIFSNELPNFNKCDPNRWVIIHTAGPTEVECAEAQSFLL